MAHPLSEIQSLDSAQLDELERCRAEWMTIADSTERIDQQTCSILIGQMYAEAFDRTPPVILFCQSPLQMQLMLLFSQLLPLERRLAEYERWFPEVLAQPIWRALWEQINIQLSPYVRARLRQASEIVHKSKGNDAERWLESVRRNPLDSLRIMDEFMGFRWWRPLLSALRTGDNFDAALNTECSAYVQNLLRDRFSSFETRNRDQFAQLTAQIVRPSVAPFQSVVRELIPKEPARNGIQILPMPTLEEIEFGYRPRLDSFLDIFGGSAPRAHTYTQTSATNIWWGAWQVGNLPLYQGLIEMFAPSAAQQGWCEQLSRICELARNALAYMFFENVCMVCARPIFIAHDDQNRLHCAAGPAIAFEDGFELYSWHGTSVAERLIRAPESITIEEIEKTTNAEVRRVMIERYGPEKFIVDCGAEFVQEDEFGTLYAKYLVADEPFVMVKVINKTPEPDGTRNEYFLRVPPNIKSARAAVAWSFAMRESEYCPGIET